MTARSWLFAVTISGAMAVAGFGPRVAAAPEDVTVRGCVEQDAASSTPSFKLIASPPAKAKIYRLTAPADIDLSRHVGHTVEVTGAVTPPASTTRPEPDLAVKSLTLISETCHFVIPNHRATR